MKYVAAMCAGGLMVTVSFMSGMVMMYALLKKDEKKGNKERQIIE